MARNDSPAFDALIGSWRSTQDKLWPLTSMWFVTWLPQWTRSRWLPLARSALALHHSIAYSPTMMSSELEDNGYLTTGAMLDREFVANATKIFDLGLGFPLHPSDNSGLPVYLYALEQQWLRWPLHLCFPEQGGYSWNLKSPKGMLRLPRWRKKLRSSPQPHSWTKFLGLPGNNWCWAGKIRSSRAGTGDQGVPSPALGFSSLQR